MDNKTYTIAELTALDNDALNDMTSGMEVFRSVFLWYVEHRNVVDYWDVEGWNPTTNANQSGELLRGMKERGFEFEIHIRQPPTVFYRQVYGEWQRVEGDDARAQTIAAIAAAMALEKRLAQ
jgi:hypothetical protein